MNLEGELLQEPKYNAIEYIFKSDSLFIVTDRNGLSSVISGNGTEIISPQKKTILRPKGMSAISIVNEEGLHSIYDLSGNQISEHKYLSFQPNYSGGIYAKRFDETYEFLDIYGHNIVDSNFKKIWSAYPHDIILATVDETKLNIMNKDGELLLSIDGRNATAITDQLLKVEGHDSLYGVYDLNGNAIIEPIYNNIVLYSDVFLQVSKGARHKHHTLYNLDGSAFTDVEFHQISDQKIDRIPAVNEFGIFGHILEDGSFEEVWLDISELEKLE